MAVLDRLAFLRQLPLLLKGTSDDDCPCPGYLYEEIAKISHDSVASCQCLLEYLLNRLQCSSCYVKLKVLKILLYLCSHGSKQFIQDLRRNVVYVQESAAVNGPPVPLHAISLYQKVRCSAQELVGSLFLDITPNTSSIVTTKDNSQTGMGPQVVSLHTLQGFGFSQGKHNLGTPSEALLSSIQRAAVAMTQAVLVGDESPHFCVTDQADYTYKPVAVPLVDQHPSSEKIVSNGAQNFRVSHCSGVPGGGWDDSDSVHSSQDSFQDKSPRSRSSDSYSKISSDSQSHISNREISESTAVSARICHLSCVYRVEPVHPGDCLQEAQLVLTVTRGQRAFLTQEEVSHFIRGCSVLNCEVVFEMLNHLLEENDASVKLRSLCAIASLVTSDLLSHDHMLAVVRKNLLKLSNGPQGPVLDKARKILLQFEALTHSSPKHRAANHFPPPPVAPSPSSLDLLTGVFSRPASEKFLILESDSTACCSFSMNESVQKRNQYVNISVTNSAVGGDIEASSPTITCDCLSLFDGMEVVSSMQRATMHQTLSPPNTITADAVSQEKTAQPCLPSVFSFLNS